MYYNRVGQKVSKCRVEFPDKHKSEVHNKVNIIPKLNFSYMLGLSRNFILKNKP